jgi:predicted transcriptional regulator of viral defense system
MVTRRQVEASLETYLRSHEVFTLDELTRAVPRRGGREAVRNALKYHVRQGRVKSVSRGVYASVPVGLHPEGYQPDRFLVASKVRSDAIFSHHAALELLGAAHSDWSVCTVFTGTRRLPVRLGSVTVRFLPNPRALERRKKPDAGTVQVTRSAVALRVTGPERTLLDGLSRPDLAGGVAELVASAEGFGVLDLELLRRLLDLYGEKLLWAATGWFLERNRTRFFVSDEYLEGLRRHRPKQPQYLLRGERGGAMARGWNLILPAGFDEGREPDER